MKKILLLSLFVNLIFSAIAADFYWVGNGGNWSDFGSHWATTSNGTTMHTRIPGIGDDIYFDQFSFSSTGQLVAVDTTTISCRKMNWFNVTNQSEFLASAYDTLIIADQLILSGTSNMTFNFFGKIIFSQPVSGQSLIFSPAGQVIAADVLVNINNGVLYLAEDLNMASKRLIVYDGELNMNSHNLYVKHFNAATLLTNAAAVNNPTFSNADSIFCFGSLHFVDALDISGFSGVINFKSNAVDSNYVNIENHSLNSDIVFSSGKKYFLISNLNTSKTLNFPMFGQFNSQGHNIYCSSFKSEDPFNRTIDLGTSEIHTEEFILETFGLTFVSESADLIFEGAGDFNFYTNNPNLSFKTLSVLSPNTLLWNGKIDVDTVSFTAGSRIYLTDNSMMTFLDLNASGNCGAYIELRAICDVTNVNIGSCVSILPVFKSINPITADYLKISNVKADGTFTLTNSFDEGGNEAWIVSEPTDVSTLYWVGNDGSWNTKENWATSSNGSTHTCIPTKATNVVFDQFSFGTNDTLRLNDYGYCAAMTWKNLTNNVVFNGSGNLFITDSIALNSFLKAEFTGNIFLQNDNSSDVISITTDGVVINAPVSIEGEALWDFKDAAIINNDFVFNSGNLLFSGNDFIVNNFISDSDGIRDLDITNTAVELTGTGLVWDLNPTNLSFISAGSDISLSGSSQDAKTFNGAGQVYNDINCIADFVKINGSNSINILKIEAGNTVNFESGTTCQIDSIDAIADCTERISLISELYDSPTTFVKTGFDTLLLNNFYIKNIVADTVGAIYFEAAQTIRSGNVDGWVFSDTVAGKTFNWIGQTKDWNNLSNWEIGGVPATCLPTINDTVVVNPVDFAAALTDTIQISRNAYCHDFIAAGILAKYLNVELSQNLNIAESLLLSDSVGFNYIIKPTADNINDYNYGVVIMPDSTNFILNPQAAAININLYINPSNITDTVFLISGLIMNTTSNLYVLSGRFDANHKNIQCGSFITESTSNKEIDISGADINLIFNLNLQDNSVLSFDADSSSISFLGNSEFFSAFYGGNQQFYDVLFSGTTNDTDNDYVVFVAGSNTFNIFNAINGLNLFVEAGKTQTVDSALIIRGSCQNYVNLNSSEDGIKCVFASNNILTDTVTCVKIANCEIQPAGVAMLSENISNNSGWTFNSTPAASPSFDMPYPACILTELTFNNTSVSMWGGTNNLVFEWIIENADTTNVENLLYTFDYQGDYTINLKATDTITGCFDTYSDDLIINNHSVNISSNVPGLAICEGSPVTFTASSDLATEFEFYLNNVWVDMGDPTINQFTTNTLQNEDSIKVIAIYNGCQKVSNSLEMVVNPAPIVSLICSDADNTICDGESITFTASGASLYEFFVDGASVGSFNSSNIYTVNDLTDSQVVTVRGKSISGCVEMSANSFTINVLANPVVLLSSVTDPPEICSGDLLSVNASGASLYEFYINGVSQGVPSVQSNYESSTLLNGNILTVSGYDTFGCTSLSNFIEVTVNPMPVTLLTSTQPDMTICTGENVVFTGSGAAEYQFFLDALSQGAYSTLETFSTSTLTHNQTISLVGRIGNCYDTVNNDITMSVFPVIGLTASTLEICPGENIEFTASGDTVYQFFVDGVPVGIAGTNPTFNTNTLTNAQQVSVQGTPGACLPGSITINVNPLPVIGMLCSDADNAICSGDLLTFTGSGAFEYEFFVDGISQGAPAEMSQFATTTLTSGQTVTVSGYSEFGCFNSSPDSYTITVYDYPVVSLASSIVGNQICEGEVAEFTAAGADEFQFFISGVSQGAYTAASTLNATAITNGSTYSVKGKSNGCASFAPETFTYTVFSLPNVNLTPISAISVCESELVSVQAAGASSYEFFVNSISQGSPSANDIFESTTLADNDQITVVGYQNICSLASPDIITVNINQIPSVVFTSDIPVTGLCFGDTAQFSISGAMSFQIFVDGLEYGEMTTENNFSIPWLEDNQIIEITGFNNSCSADAANNIVADVNYVIFDVNSDYEENTLCNGEVVTLTATGSDIYEFFLDGVSMGAAGPTSSIVINNMVDNQFVNVEATDAVSGCKAMSSDYYFHVSDIPQIFVGSDTQFCQYDSVVLTTNSDYNLQWYLNSEIIEGANIDSYSAYAGGLYSVFAISGSDGGVFSSGINNFGQLGTGNNMQSLETNQAILNNTIKMLSTGEDFEIAITENGDLMAWGNNEWGNLGIGTFSPVYTPVQIAGISEITEISAGYHHVLALKNDSTLMSWGQNSYGQLGYGNYASGNFPMPISGLDSITAIAAGKSHSIALTSDGRVYTWGLNNFGQLGTGNLENSSLPLLVSGIDSVIFIAAGANHSFAIRYDGTLWAWGSNDNGQLGINSLNSKNIPVKVPELKAISTVTAGMKHSVAVNQRGEIYTWGSNTEGQLGSGETSSSLIPIKLSFNGVKSATCGTNNTFAIKNDGTLWSWGQNNFGQLGDQSTENKIIPVKASQYFGIDQVSAGSEFVSVIWKNAHTCASTQVALSMDSVPNVIITKYQMTLTSTAGQSYQWYFNGSILSNTNSQTITITAEGVYTVEVFFESGCSAMSEEYSFYLSIDDWFVENNVQIAPNPNNGSFELIINMPGSALNEITSYALVSVSGAIIATEESFQANARQYLNFADIEPGAYYLTLRSSFSNINIKLFITQ